MRSTFPLLLFGVFTLLAVSIQAQSVTINPTADNTLYEQATGSLSNGAGQYLFSGRTNQGSNSIRRAVLQFDVAGNVPVGATITGATLTLNMNRSISGAQNISIHPLTTAWGEGTSNAPGQEGGGTTSTTNDATWIHAFFSTTNWTTPGGDFAATASAITSVAGNGSYSWSSATVTSDVQGWFSNPTTNNGWIMIGNESSSTTAKRFASKEFGTAANRPQLTITYTVACTDPDIPTLMASSTSVCAGDPATITATGNLNDATAWALYTGSCGGTLVSTNATGVFTVSLTAATTYFVRGEGGCVTPGSCATVSIGITPAEDGGFSFGKAAYCEDENDPTPTITGTTGGAFSATPAGLSISTTIGTVDLSLSTPGAYTVKYVTPGINCQDSSTQTVVVNPTPVVADTTAICTGDSLLFDGQFLKVAGDYTGVFQTSAGCDSTVNLRLDILTAFVISDTVGICPGDSVILGQQVIKVSGDYTESFITAGGCDSTVNLRVDLLTTFVIDETVSICSGDSVIFGTQVITVPGMYTELFTSSVGCDSTVNLVVSVVNVEVAVSLTDSILTAAAPDASYQWINCADNTPIDSATSQSFTPKVSGEYAVVIVVGQGCVDTSECTVVDIFNSIADAFTIQLNAFPNPTTSGLTVDFGKVYPQINLSILSIHGQVLSEMELNNSASQELSLEEMPAGLYLIQVESDGERGLIRVVKE